MIQIWKGVGPLLPKHHDLIRKIDFSKLAMIMPIIRSMQDEQKILDWLHMAETNTVKDLENNIREKGGTRRALKPTDTCPHPLDQIGKRLFVKCRLCGGLFPEGEERVTRVREVLEQAKKAIKALHGDLSWEEYNRSSPEMKAVNGLLREYGSKQLS
jgi:hypothetical protein